MPRHTLPSIDKDYGGITPYLSFTKHEHNGYDAAVLKKHWNWGQGKHMNVTALALMFNVSWATMEGWIDRIHIEAGIPRPGKDLAITPKVTDNGQ